MDRLLRQLSRRVLWRGGVVRSEALDGCIVNDRLPRWTETRLGLHRAGGCAGETAGAVRLPLASDRHHGPTSLAVVRAAETTSTARFPSVKYGSPVRFRRGEAGSHSPTPST